MGLYLLPLTAVTTGRSSCWEASQLRDSGFSMTCQPHMRIVMQILPLSISISTICHYRTVSNHLYNNTCVVHSTADMGTFCSAVFKSEWFCGDRTPFKCVPQFCTRFCHSVWRSFPYQIPYAYRKVL